MGLGVGERYARRSKIGGSGCGGMHTYLLALDTVCIVIAGSICNTIIPLLSSGMHTVDYEI